MNKYIRKLVSLGFDRDQAERIDEGRRIKALSEKELLHFVAAFENDEVEPMKPLVEKYGWEELIERLENSTYERNE